MLDIFLTTLSKTEISNCQEHYCLHKVQGAAGGPGDPKTARGRPKIQLSQPNWLYLPRKCLKAKDIMMSKKQSCLLGLLHISTSPDLFFSNLLLQFTLLAPWCRAWPPESRRALDPHLPSPYHTPFHTHALTNLGITLKTREGP